VVEFAVFFLLTMERLTIGDLSDSCTDRAQILLPDEPLDAILTLIIRFRDADWFGLVQRPAVHRSRP
jgi:hypothetical protein